MQAVIRTRFHVSFPVAVVVATLGTPFAGFLASWYFS